MTIFAKKKRRKSKLARRATTKQLKIKACHCSQLKKALVHDAKIV